MNELMSHFLVTVKLSKNPAHDPRNKISGPCPVSGKLCTDVTGEHHTYLTTGLSTASVRESAMAAGWSHITRIEEV
jgi:hypothetical protein